MNKFYFLAVTLICFTFATPAQVAPDEALAKLKAGNKRYLSQTFKTKDFAAQREEQKKGQHPYAIILTCADSRVPPEHIFDEDLGQLFVVRVAGNVIDEVTLGSIEYAAEHLHVQLLVVLGHSACGAVKATIEGGDFGKNINVLAGKIKPAVDAAKAQASDKSLVLPLAVEGNVELQAEHCYSESEILQELRHKNEFKVMCGIYRIETGEVVLSEPVMKFEEGHAPGAEPKKEHGAEKHELGKPELKMEKSKETSAVGYQFGSDSQVKGTIFSDGKQYSFQVSSWRNKAKAEREAEKLAKHKDRVFIMPFTHPETRQTWYRVRVGAFPTITDAEKFQSRME